MPDMTCEEFHSYLAERNALGDAAASAHAGHCADCSGLIVTQEELARCLRAVRESAPEVSQAVDFAVLNAYRREKGSRAGAGLSVAKRLVWVPIAAVLLIAAALWLMGGHEQPVANPVTVKVGVPPEAQQATQPKVIASSDVPTKPKVKLERVRRNLHSERPAVATVAKEDREASGFRDLMYCDPISCGGPMQVIRIQIPEFPSNAPSPRTARGLTQADVVVGPDGVARAIRFVRY
jgi:hypothetical protein